MIIITQSLCLEAGISIQLLKLGHQYSVSMAKFTNKIKPVVESEQNSICPGWKEIFFLSAYPEKNLQSTEY